MARLSRREFLENSMLAAAAAVGQIAAREDELGALAFDQREQRPFDRRVVLGAEMEIGDVQDARSHRRSRL